MHAAGSSSPPSQNHHHRIDADELKRRAVGHWPGILARVGVPADVLDGRNRPCPRCGGTDRFRALNDFRESGAVLCNKCFSADNGDGLAALMHYGGMDFPAAVNMAAAYLGMDGSPSRNGHATPPSPAPAPAPAVAPAAPPADGLKSQIVLSYAPQGVATWVAHKPPITETAAARYGARTALWPARAPEQHQQPVIAFPGRHADGQLAAILLYHTDGSVFPAFGTLAERKLHTVRGSSESIVWPGTPSDLAAAPVLVHCEGLPDMLAAASALDPADGMMPISNVCGANSTSLDYSIARGKQVFVCGDADRPGQAGAAKKAAGYVAAGATEVRLVTLPYEITADHGKDLRDYLAEGGSLWDLLYQHSHVVTAETAAAEVEAADQGDETPPIEKPTPITDLIATYPTLRPVVIGDLLRACETMNLIASPKRGKSWLVNGLSIAVATGSKWLDTFSCLLDGS